MKTVPLRGIAEMSRVIVDPSVMPTQVSLFSIPALDAGAPETVASEEIDSHKLRLRGGEVLISRLNPRKPRVHLVAEGLNGYGVASTEFVALVPTRADPRFLRYFLLSESVRQHLDSQVRSATRSHQRVEPGTIMALSVPEIVVEDQRRIADFLDDRVSRIDRIIAARREQLELAAACQQAQLSEVMDRQAELSGLAPLRRFCAGIEQGSSPVAEDRPASPGESGVLKTSAVFRGAFFPERYKVIDGSDPDGRHLVRTGDVIVIRGSGSAELVGDAAVAHMATNGPPLHLSDLTYRLRDLDLIPHYAVMALISSRGRSELGSLVRQGSGPAKARGDDIMSISVPIATMDEQRLCVKTEAKVREQWKGASNDLNRSIDLLTEYKSSLITAAVTGELDVTTAGSTIPG